MEDKIKKIYKVVTETPKLKDAFTGITEDQFRTALQDEKAQDALYDDLVAYDLVTKGDPNEFWTKKGLRQPKVAAPQPSQPPAVSLAPPQRQSIEQQAARQEQIKVPTLLNPSSIGQELPLSMVTAEQAVEPMVQQPQNPSQPVGILSQDKGPDLTQVQRNLVMKGKQPQAEPNIFQKAVSYGKDLVKSVERGLARGKAANVAKPTNLFNGTASDAEIDEIARINREIKQIGSTAVEQDFSKHEGVWDTITDWIKVAPPTLIESMAMLGRSGYDEIAAGTAVGAGAGSIVPVIGTAAGAATGFTAGSIAAGAGVEFFSSFFGELEKMGVDTGNPQAIKAALKNPEILSKARKTAAIRAGVIGGGSALVGAAASGLKPIASGLTQAAGEFGVELGAQAASGQDINLEEAGLEAIGELPVSAITAKGFQAARKAAPTQLGGIPTIPAPPNAPEFVPPVPPPSEADQTTYETVTPEELQAFQTDPNFATNNPERAAAIADDVALIQSGQMDINSIEDANYRVMVESAMGVGQQEQQGVAAELSQINDRILTIKAAAQEGRIEGDPAEYAALKKRKAELESQVKTEVEVETDPAVADIERRREEELAKFREDNPIQLRPIEVLDQNGNVIQSSSGEFAINKKYDAEIAALQSKGTTTQQAAEEVSRNQELDNVVRNIPIEDVRRPNGAIGTQGFTSTQLKDLIKFINTNLNLGISEDLFNGEKLKPLIDYIKNSPDLVQKIQDYVKKDPIEISIMPDDTIIINDGNHRANLLNLIGSDVLPTIEAAQRNQVDEINAKYDALQSNATPQSETIVADQAAQNMGTAVNQPLETGAAAVEVGESGRPVVEVEGDQVVEEEKPAQQIAAKEQAEGKAETPKAGSVVGGEVEEKVSGLQHTKSQLKEIAKEEGIDNAIASFKKDLSVKENRLAELTKYEKGKLPSQKTKTKEIQSLEKRIEEVRKDVENLEKIKVEQSLKEAPKPKAEKTSPLTPFQTKDKEGQAARAALKESVGPKEFKRLENIAKNGEKILRDLESRNVLKIDCP